MKSTQILVVYLPPVKGAKIKSARLADNPAEAEAWQIAADEQGVKVVRVPIAAVLAVPSLLAACNESERALTNLRVSGDKQDWESFRPLHKALRLCSKALEEL